MRRVRFHGIYGRERGLLHGHRVHGHPQSEYRVQTYTTRQHGQVHEVLRINAALYALPPLRNVSLSQDPGRLEYEYIGANQKCLQCGQQSDLSKSGL